MAEPAMADRLRQAIERHDSLAVAVSGGVDSMTLASFGHRFTATDITAIHAVSPAVPARATERVHEQAEHEGWTLTVTGAGEFEDRRYRDNPANRCYFCKSNLYARIAGLTPHRIASGANVDDLGDYRPGLTAAAERNVVHPYVEAGMTKDDVRKLARAIGLDAISELAAQPCLASRVETGIAIDAGDLAFVESTERSLSELAGPQATLRCRITARGVVLEVGPEAAHLADAMEARVREFAGRDGRRFAGLRGYERGSMFVRD